jgi:hypothetical protein
MSYAALSRDVLVMGDRTCFGFDPSPAIIMIARPRSEHGQEESQEARQEEDRQARRQAGQEVARILLPLSVEVQAVEA